LTNFADIDDAVAVTTGSSTTPAHRGLKPYSQLAAVFLCGAFAFFDVYSTQPILPMLSRIFHATEVHVGLTISASTIGVALSAVLLAVFGEDFSRKRVIVFSLLALSVCTMLTATATTLNVLVAWRFLQGLLTPGVFILTIAYVTEEWPSALVPRVMSSYVAGTVFGGFAGRFLGGIIAAYLGWRSVFAVLGVGLLCGAAIIQWLLIPGATHAKIKHPSRFAPLLHNARNPRLLATFGVGFCMLFTLVSVFSYVTFYLAAAPFHLSTQALSYLFAVYLVGLVATLAAGTFLAKFGLRNGLLSAIALCIGGVALTLVHSLAAVALGLAICSSGVFIAQTCANSFLREAAPSGARVAAAGMYICSYYIGGTFGGVLPGVAWKLAGWPGCVALTCGLLVVAALLAIFGWPSHSAEPEPVPL
jgi:YNFM family putative membrane transporter